MSTTQVVPFQFDSHEIRVVSVNDNPWFVAKDVAEALEYARFDSNLLRHVPDEWKDTNPIRTPNGVQEMLTLSEPGLYFFVNRSDKPKALPFQKWIAGEVLPSIRKTGSYALPNASKNPRLILGLINAYRAFDLSHNPWTQQGLILGIVSLSDYLGIPVPPLHLIGKPADQMQLEV